MRAPPFPQDQRMKLFLGYIFRMNYLIVYKFLISTPKVLSFNRKSVSVPRLYPEGVIFKANNAEKTHPAPTPEGVGRYGKNLYKKGFMTVSLLSMTSLCEKSSEYRRLHLFSRAVATMTESHHERLYFFSSLYASDKVFCFIVTILNVLQISLKYFSIVSILIRLRARTLENSPSVCVLKTIASSSAS